MKNQFQLKINRKTYTFLYAEALSNEPQLTDDVQSFAKYIAKELVNLASAEYNLVNEHIVERIAHTMDYKVQTWRVYPTKKKWSNIKNNSLILTCIS